MPEKIAIFFFVIFLVPQDIMSHNIFLPLIILAKNCSICKMKLLCVSCRSQKLFWLVSESILPLYFSLYNDLHDVQQKNLSRFANLSMCGFSCTGPLQ